LVQRVNEEPCEVPRVFVRGGAARQYNGCNDDCDVFHNVIVERQEQAPALAASSSSGMERFMLSVNVRQLDDGRRLPGSTGSALRVDESTNEHAQP
jgi:hypothetical protein